MPLPDNEDLLQIGAIILASEPLVVASKPAVEAADGYAFTGTNIVFAPIGGVVFPQIVIIS